MSEEIDKEALQDLLVRRLLGELVPEERERLERALAEDSALAEEARSLDRTVERLAGAASAEPPARLRARVLGSGPVQRRWNLPLALAASAAVLATIACAVLVMDRIDLERRLDLQRSASVMLREPNVVLSFALEGSGSAAAASGVALLDLDARRASIAVEDLAAPPAGRTYHLWAVLESKSVFCGEFLPRADGRILTQFAIPVDSYTSPIEKLVLTVEARDARAAPQGPVVMSST